MANATSTKGTKLCVLAKSATGTPLVPTAISKATPAEVSVAATTGLKAGMLVKFPATGATGATGFAELDGKVWAVANVTGTTFDLVGSDTTASTATLAGTPSITAYQGANDMACICASVIEFNPEDSNTVSVATFCDPTATIPSQVVGAGTVNLEGYVDTNDAGFLELLKASEDGVSRDFRITRGDGTSYYLFSGIVGNITPTLPLDGAEGFSTSITLGSKYRFLF